MNQKSKIQNYFIALLALVILFSAAPVFAAELFFEAKSREFTPGEEFLVSFFLNTENEGINAVEGKIVFPEKLLELKEIRDGNSIINFWVERPHAGDGDIFFSGIIPGGYQETKGFLLSVVFQAKAEGEGAMEIRDAKVLLNDGKGTPTNVKISNFTAWGAVPASGWGSASGGQFSIFKQVPNSEFQIPVLADVETIKDTDLPEDFKPEIAQSEEMFDGKYFLVFATQDKGSGIDRYEVCEGSKTRCVIAASPYVLQNQKLNQKIFVKAIDKNGNERVVALPPQKPLPWYRNYIIFAILIIAGLAIVSAILRKILWREKI